MLPPAVKRWLEEHNKGDLQECTWEELNDALASAGISCPLAERSKIGSVAEKVDA